MAAKRQAFRKLVDEALESLPTEFRPYLDNVVIQIEEGEGDLYGLYLGTPLPERGHDPSPYPDRILLYRRALEQDFPDPEELRREVITTVLHELAHHFGLGEDRLEDLGWG
ncbi:MAG: metallopeptidase family protein [Acidobacteria bacterium]|nr:metallopeptidase family protein [Acidobacteriota bacterium]